MAFTWSSFLNFSTNLLPSTAVLLEKVVCEQLLGISSDDGYSPSVIVGKAV